MRRRVYRAGGSRKIAKEIEAGRQGDRGRCCAVTVAGANGGLSGDHDPDLYSVRVSRDMQVDEAVRVRLSALLFPLLLPSCAAAVLVVLAVDPGTINIQYWVDRNERGISWRQARETEIVEKYEELRC